MLGPWSCTMDACSFRTPGSLSELIEASDDMMTDQAPMPRRTLSRRTSPVIPHCFPPYENNDVVAVECDGS